MSAPHDHRQRALLIATASALSLAFAACGDNPSPTDVVQIPQRADRTAQADGRDAAAGNKLEKAAAIAERKLDDAGNAVKEQAAAAGKMIEDAAITAKVKSALIAEPELKSFDIDVDTSGGIVTLRGVAGSQTLKSKAERIAATVEGVRSVRNELVVVQT